MPSSKIVVKLDSLFNTYADAIVIPRSTTGTISDGIRKDIRQELQIDFPEKLEYRPLGALDISQHHNLNRRNNQKVVFHLLLATCVDNNTSTYDAIDDIARKIAEFTVNNPTVREVALPLLGTGAGRLDHLKVYEILTRDFIQFSREDAVMEIYTNDERIYNVLLRDDSRSTNGMPDVPLTNEQKQVMGTVLEKVLKDHELYLAGAKWGNEDQANLFFSQGIWKNGNDEKFTEVVNRIKVGSIIVLKSTFARGETSYLRIKGVGLVTLNSGNGHEISVNWRIKNMELDIAHKGSYRSTIAKIEPGAGAELLRSIPEWYNIIFALFPPDDDAYQPEIRAQDAKLAGLLSDADDGEDHLEIQHDIDAFAKIMAAESFRPPLAIALFGKWGTGKSFFMNKLRSRIDYYKRLDEKTFCSGIAHIHFNAWSYLDANLWASLVSKIFEGLDEYIKDHKKSDKHTSKIKSELIEELSLNFLETDRIKKEQSDLKDNIEALNANKALLSSQLAEKMKAINKSLVTKLIDAVDKEFQIKDKVKTAFQENASVTAANKELKKIVPEEYLKDPAKTLKEIKSTRTFLKVFFSKDKWLSNLLWLAGIILIAIYIPKGLHWVIKKINGVDLSIPPVDVLVRLLGIAAPFLILIKKTTKQIGKLVKSLWKIKEDFEAAKKEAEDNVAKEDAELSVQIYSEQQKLSQIGDKLAESEKKQTILAYKKEHALSTETLYQFIGKRSLSEDYQQHLGIVSLIRHDFEALSELFYGHKEESKHKDFRANFERPLQRIILYIDDLDRCREDRVVEVLEAVNLLMAFPLFIVVVGVDPRWVRNALINRYSNQFSNTIAEHTESSDYLEKIFQVPFHLKAANEQNIRTMIRTLAKPAESPDEEIDSDTTIDDESTIIQEESLTDKDNGSEISEPVTSDPHVRVVFKQEQLKLSGWEIDLMEDMSPVLGNNPRGIKRFVNIYQIVRAHAGLNYMAAHEKREFLAIQFLVALYNGCYRKIAPYLVHYMHAYRHEEKLLSTFLEENPKTPSDVIKLKKELLVALSDKPRQQELLRINMATFKTHNTFIQRFSFDEITVTSIIPDE